MRTWWASESVCDCGAGFVYLDDQVMQCQRCKAVFTREAPTPSPRPPDPEERIADALESIAQSLRKIAYPDQWLVPSPEQSMARSLELLASCVEPGTSSGLSLPRLRTS
jgi:hypothetical protein